MSWGERSCKPPCRVDNCSESICNVNCPGYIFDGKTAPDTVVEQPKPTPFVGNRAQRRAMARKKR